MYMQRFSHDGDVAVTALIWLLPCFIVSVLVRVSSSESIVSSCDVIYQNPESVQLNFMFHLNTNLNVNDSLWQFGLERCEAEFSNFFCVDWAVSKRYNCRPINNFSVLCEIPQFKIREPDCRFKFIAKYNSTDSVEKEFAYGYHSTKCLCKDFYFDPKLYIFTTPLLGKANIEMRPFMEFGSPNVEGYDIEIMPNDSLVIDKENSKYGYQISGFDICETHNVSIKLGTHLKCSNWKLNPDVLSFSTEKLIVDTLYCSFNSLQLNISITSVANSAMFFLNLTVAGVSFIKNLTNENFSIPIQDLVTLNTIERLPQNITIFVSMCTHGCNKCGPRQSYTCRATFKTTVPPEHAVQSERTVSWKLFLGIIGGAIGVIIFILVIMVICFKYIKKNTSVTSKDLITPYNQRLRASESSEADTLIEPLDGEPIYEEIKNFHDYEKPDILPCKTTKKDPVKEVIFPEGDLSEAEFSFVKS